MSATPSPNTSPAGYLVHEQQMASIGKVILKLSPECQRVFLLKRVYGMSCKQIAVLSGIPVSRVEKDLAKALALLKGCIADQE
ncbi:RNA polymerase sigma factor [Dyella acidisoli]|uniref:RNA polymerase sigma factor 70 region 4 type 2 domain-containing protein n=1 Tax=Dyella acidisoli TaxID=1867834 RepID=A0ABQ5XN33_9GAMM|nr:sigma-70 family RNA polymerase sigma factor [Dyella acidisoli]GLQ93100.1 hypothetical protein GCM10007901_20510 [Dyella acidisoli]